MTLTTRHIVLLLSAILLFVTQGFALPGKHDDDDDYSKGYKCVKPGQSIQKALDKARRGDKIVVEPGTYTEQLTIKTDGITLVGRPGIVLTAPASFGVNYCTNLAGPGTEAGICIQGKDVTFDAFVTDHAKVSGVGRPIRDVTVTGFEVRGFSGENIAVVGGKNIRVSKNKLVDGQKYGFLTAGSKNTLAQNNVITASAGPLLFIAMCMDDTASAEFSGNDISGYFISFCMQTDNGVVKKNTAKDTCYGAFIDPGVKGAVFEKNTVSNISPQCQDTFGASGVIITGAVNTLVQFNTITGFKNSTSISGILLIDDVITGQGLLANGNVVRRNTLSDNDVDIFVATNGTGNVVRNNACTTSNPPGLCS